MLMCSHYALSMRPSLSIPKAPHVLSSSFHKNQEDLQRLRREQRDLYKKVTKISSLKKEEQNGVLDGLSQQEKSMLLENMDEEKRKAFYSVLFNQNESVTNACCKQGSELVLEKYAKAKQLMNRCPIQYGDKPLAIQHYMLLSEEEVQSFSTIHKRKLIFSFSGQDVHDFIYVSMLLQKIDPEIRNAKSFTDKMLFFFSNESREYPLFGQECELKYSKSFTNSVKRYPAWSEDEYDDFYLKSVKPNISAYCLAGFTACVGSVAAMKLFLPDSKLGFQVMSGLSILAAAGIAEASANANYQKALEDDIPIAASLTDLLPIVQGKTYEQGDCQICSEKELLMDNVPCNNDRCEGAKGEWRTCWDCYEKMFIKTGTCPLCRALLRNVPAGPGLEKSDKA